MDRYSDFLTNTQGNNLIGWEIYSGSQLQSFQSMVSWLHCLEPVVKREAHSQEVVADQSCSPQSIQEVDRKQEVARDRLSFIGRPLMIHICNGSPPPNNVAK